MATKPPRRAAGSARPKDSSRGPAAGPARPKRSRPEGPAQPRRPKVEGAVKPRRPAGEEAARPRRPDAEGPAKPRRSEGEPGGRSPRPKAEGSDRPRRPGGEDAARPRRPKEGDAARPRPDRKPADPARARVPGGAGRAGKSAYRKAPATPRAGQEPRKPAGLKVQGQERLQKILAHAGIDSRRKCEELILAGRVHVNGRLVTELGAKADPRRDQITLDFQPLQREAPVYILLNKPKGYVTTVQDDEGRPTVMALLHGVTERVYPVGRLDFNSEGLLLLTNDGALAKKVSDPDSHIPKVYMVKVHRIPPRPLLDELRGGFLLDGRRLQPCRIEMVEKVDNPWLKVTLIEGKNRQIRKMFEAVGHPVHKLRRIAYGPLEDPALKPGAWRFLTAQEVAALQAL